MSNNPLPKEDTLLTQEQCAALAGVSEETIHRFSQFGLLKGVIQGGKSPLFRKEDVVSLFHIDSSLKKDSTPAPASSSEKQQSATQQSVTQQLDEQRPPKEFVVIQGGVKQNDDAVQQTGAPAAEEPIAVPKNETQEIVAAAQQPTVPSSVPSAVASQRQDNELLEINRMLREQIQSLKEDRDWLRERLEKLESLSEREHMLLFSNSETIRNLLVENQKKRLGFWSRALPWLRIGS